jgi:hypothetical protein
VLARLANGLFAAAGAAGAAQFPAFYRQYLQNLAGRLAQARDDLAPVLQDARERGLTLSDYLDRAQAEGGELTGTLVAGYRATHQAFDRLQAAHQALSSAGPLERPLALARHVDLRIAESTLDSFAPALPLTLEGGGYALAGLLVGLLTVWTLERPALAVRRRRRARQLRRQTARAAAQVAPRVAATKRQSARLEPRLLPARTAATERALDPAGRDRADDETATPRPTQAGTFAEVSDASAPPANQENSPT